MITGHVIAALLPTAARSVRRWLFQLGGLGLIPLGLLDNSPIPLPGIMDVATIVLSARQEQLWLYYALMATGGFGDWRLCHHTGSLAREGKKRSNAGSRPGKWTKFARSSSDGGSALLSSLLCCRRLCPWFHFLFAAGAMQYPARKFLAALTLGRISRYMILAYLAARYGRQIIAFIAEHGHPVVVGIIVVLLATAAVVFYFWRGSKSKKWTWTFFRGQQAVPGRAHFLRRAVR